MFDLTYRESIELLETLTDMPSCKTLKKVLLFDTLSFADFEEPDASIKLGQFVDAASALEELDIRGGCKRTNGGLMTLIVETAQHDF